MNNVELARTLSWRENALFEEREKKDKLMLSGKRVVKMLAVRQQSFRNRQAAFLPYNKEYEKIKLMTYKLNYP